jgi:hypothetical protein
MGLADRFLNRTDETRGITLQSTCPRGGTIKHENALCFRVLVSLWFFQSRRTNGKHPGNAHQTNHYH